MALFRYHTFPDDQKDLLKFAEFGFQHGSFEADTPAEAEKKVKTFLRQPANVFLVMMVGDEFVPIVNGVALKPQSSKKA